MSEDEEAPPSNQRFAHARESGFFATLGAKNPQVQQAAGEAGGEAENSAPELVRELGEKSLTLVLAESCTAGLAADLVARIPGASKVFWGSFVSYTIDAKVSMLGLEREKIEKHGAVSGETACSMAEGALKKSGASLAGAVTGLAGPDGDGSGTPVGTVWIATATGEGAEAEVFHYHGSRDGIRHRAASRLIMQVLKRIKGIDNKH